MGLYVLKIFRIACSKHTDKDKTSRWYLDTDRLLFAYETYDITDKEEIFQFINLALQILNGEDEILVTDEDQPLGY